ncbi:histidine kinase [Brevibacillus ginsengisoli]|uniref:sensor histidine kinase n=1 Tax=Brevibacillus ginsengisoli TaxID=363854 RepID=UPI003CFA17D5
MKLEWYKSIMDHLSEGIVIMDDKRTIHYLNESASEMTSWRIGETVPHCSYCKIRGITEGVQRCLLSQENPLPIFQSNMPTYNGDIKNFHMRTTHLRLDGADYIVLALRNSEQEEEEGSRKVKNLLVRETMMAQEAERKRIAMELHDQIGQSIYSIFLGLQSMKHVVTDSRYQKHLGKMELNLENTLENVKRLSTELRPAILDHLGLEKAISSMVDIWQDAYPVIFETHVINVDRLKLPKDANLHIFRIIQEAVHNAVRHGKPRTIKIHCSIENDNLFFQVTDDGIGYDPNGLLENSFGMYHMMERIDMIGGKLTLFSQIGGPTRVEGVVPLPQPQENS